LKFSTSAEYAPAKFENHDLYGRKQWRIAHTLANHFWKRWIQEVLPEITRRTKWYEPTKPLQIGDTVIVVDPDQQRHTWPLGRIENVYADNQGHGRFADVKVGGKVYKRPAVKLAVLDINQPKTKF
jgi:hypothetical protein